MIAPSSYPAYPEFSLYEGLEYVKSLGFKVLLGETLKNAASKWYLSADDEARANDVNWAFEDNRVDAIVCARGGSGALRILQFFDYDLIRSHPKLFVGYSDITPIQNAIFNLTGLVSIQGPMVGVGFGKDADVKRTKRDWHRLLLLMSGRELSLGEWQGGPSPLTIKGGKATGTLVGGNLTLFTLLSGSRYMPDGKGKILFLEGINEEAWRIDNCMASLEAGGYLGKVSSVVLGDFPRKPETTDPVRLEELFRSYLSSKPYPSFLNYPCCHGFGNEPFPIGIRAEVDADSRLITMQEPVTD